MAPVLAWICRSNLRARREVPSRYPCRCETATRQLLPRDPTSQPLPKKRKRSRDAESVQAKHQKPLEGFLSPPSRPSFSDRHVIFTSPSSFGPKPSDYTQTMISIIQSLIRKILGRSFTIWTSSSASFSVLSVQKGQQHLPPCKHIG